MSETVVIAARYRGPSQSGNGGYSCGLAAGLLDAAVTSVALRAPPPLDTPLTVARDADRVRLVDASDRIVAEARASSLSLDVPQAPPFEAVRDAEARYVAARDHFFPECFVCGPARAPGDGLRIFAGPVEDRPGLVAARWVPDASLAEGATIAREHVWAALDCPGYFGSTLAETRSPAVLASLTARVDRVPRPGERLRCLGWPIASEGRKHRVGTAVVDEDGTVIARVEGLWIALDPVALASFVR